MIKVVGIGGMPLTGKSTLLSCVVDKLGESALFNHGPIQGKVFPQSRAVVVGREYGRSISSDQLRHTYESVTEFIGLAKETGAYQGYTMLFEGDRLFTTKFYCWCKYAGIRRSFYMLSSKPGLAEARDPKRFATYSAEYLRLKRVKYLGICRSGGFRALLNDDRHDLRKNVDIILSELF